tara:strand:+ start:3478 stop:4323 length:846 start_codon:yes stop_codon:yes gene_type:complete
MKELLVCTFSGGRTSAFMSQYILNSSKYDNFEKIFIFANTGKERKETLDFINKCDSQWNLNIIWLEAKINETKGVGTSYNIVDYKNADRTGKVFERMLKKYPLPNAFASNCTRELKLKPIEKYVKDLGYDSYTTALGIRYDERHRKSLKAKENKIIYPLCDDIKVDGAFIRKWWERQTFDLKLKDYEGNCDLCFKKSVRKRMTLIKENKDIAKWWINMESKYGNEVVPRFDLRSNLSIEEIVKKAQEPFQSVEDVYELSKKQVSIFNEDLDYETDCFCKAN